MHPDGDALHRCMIAHYMADMQADPRQELLWDRRALEAAGSLTGAGAKEYHPSLHLNLAEGYRKLGDWDAAREHLAQATEFALRTAGEWLRQYDPPRYRLPGRSA